MIDFALRVGDVDQVVRHEAVFVEVLAGSDIHAAVDLPRIDADDFGRIEPGQLYRQRGFPGGRRPGDDDCFDFFRHKTLQKNCTNSILRTILWRVKFKIQS